MDKIQVSSTVHTTKIIITLTKMECDEFDFERNTRNFMLELSKHTSYIFLNFVGDDLRKVIVFFHRVVKINCIVVVCDLFDVFNEEFLLESTKNPTVFRLLKREHREDEKIARRILYYTQKVNFILILLVRKLTTRMVGRL